ncbi:fatty acid-binding protein 1, liver-like [Carcharodon carcharias]|uniref:fatty acid-binding protein 1, liver-like n=1 Tax=Carcharodon carcharias TaxID=13397 RepID=UPI001B7EBCAF|nr:fatty acid-binding protein 1, liver-like [Carcharodon carcharias]
MAFNGKYELESQENFEQLMKALGLSDEVIKKYKDLGNIVEFVQNGNSFQTSYNYGSKVITNEFTIGQESEFVLFTGHRVKAFAKLEGENKLVITMEGMMAAMELSGDKMIETLTNGEITVKKIRKKI